MAISIVGTIVAGSAINGGDVALTLPTTIARDDIVYIWGGHFTRAATSVGPSTSGYTSVLSVSPNNQTFAVYRKQMGASPDATVTGVGTGNAADATAYAAIVLRGVDAASPEDATPVSAYATSADPDPPWITSVTGNAWVLALAASIVNDAAVTAPSGYSGLIGANGNDTNPCSAYGAYLALGVPTPENPGAFGSWASGQWVAATVAVRPSPMSRADVAATYRPDKYL